MENFQTILQSTLESYEKQLINHPLSLLIKKEGLDLETLREIAGLQYVDSVLWVPMLALMKDRVQNPKLKEALLDNLLCEAGATHTSHVTLCLEFIESLGVSPYYGDFSKLSSLGTQPVEMMNSVTGLNEGEIAGWILASEFLVPPLFKALRPAFARIPGVKLRYLEDHIVVDSDEHAQWMFDSCLDLSKEGKFEDDILSGLHMGGRTALSVPDAVYAKHIRKRRASFRRDGAYENLYAHLA